MAVKPQMKGFTWGRKIDIKIPLDRLHASEVIAPKENFGITVHLVLFHLQSSNKRSAAATSHFVLQYKVFLGFCETFASYYMIDLSYIFGVNRIHPQPVQQNFKYSILHSYGLWWLIYDWRFHRALNLVYLNEYCAKCWKKLLYYVSQGTQW